MRHEGLAVGRKGVGRLMGETLTGGLTPPAAGASPAAIPDTFSRRAAPLRRSSNEVGSPMLWGGLSPGPHGLRLRVLHRPR
ncbi:hypothetical protein [Streptomyces phaeochromogenes]|uniref:hypothetical protein n=1 Tax=Streptomyces phaeochromogenes TaxID=1923 RepID=UPI003CCB78BE